MASAEDVEIISIEAADAGAVVVGRKPLSGPLVLANSSECKIISSQPDPEDGMVPEVHRPMVVVRLPVEEEEEDDEPVTPTVRSTP